MSKGIIYCMTSIVPGIVKIGKTGSDNFEKRMYSLEKNGYSQVVGLKRRFAIEVDDYDAKETLLHEIFSKSRVADTELFAVDESLVVQLLSSFEGRTIFPKSMSKEDTFEAATDEREARTISKNLKLIPEGIYTLREIIKGIGEINASMEVKNGRFIVKKGSNCLQCNSDWAPEARRTAIIDGGILQKDTECNSPSTAGWVVLGGRNNGWKVWKNSEGKPIDVYRNTSFEE